MGRNRLFLISVSFTHVLISISGGDLGTERETDAGSGLKQIESLSKEITKTHPNKGCLFHPRDVSEP